MFLNYLKLSLRLMARNPFFTIINVAGLSVGFAVFFFSYQYSQNELNSDRQWQDWGRIVRCGFIWRYSNDGGGHWGESNFGTQFPEIALRVSQDFAEIEDMTRIFRQPNFTPEYVPMHGKEIFLTRVNEKGELISFKETSLAYADPNLFSFFSIRLIAGSREKLLEEINSVVISERLATRYFGSESPLDQTLLINNSIPLKVTGVFQDLPQNTHLDFEAAISTKSIQRFISSTQNSNGGAHTYFKLQPGINWQEFEKKLNSTRDYYWKEKIANTLSKAEFYLQPLSEVPFSNFVWDYLKPKSRYFLEALGWIGILTLAVAWVNFIQLSASFYRKRMKEVGIRKTTGAKSKDFFKQFLIESLIINLLSLLLAATVIQVAKDPLRLFFDFYVLPWSEIPSSSLIMMCITCLAGIAFSALLPMFFFRSHGPQSLFKKQLARSGFLAFTNPLVAAQFGFSIVLIIWLFTVHSQTEFIMEADYGLNRKEVVLIDLPQVRTDHFRADLSYLIENLKAKAGVQDVAYFSNITGDAGNNKICLKRIETQENTCAETNGGVSANFVAFFNIKLLAGRNFIQDLPSDSSVIIINRKASQELGFKGPEDAVGRRILVNTGDWNNWKYREAEIIGVVENYHGNSSLLIDDVGSHGDNEMVLTYNDQLIPLIKPQKLAFRVGPNQFESTSRGLQKLYESVFPGQLFRFYFLDNQVAKYYVGEKTARNQILLITVIAIGIACLGLLGMISNKVVEKTKEIGIRKILGAALHQIASILLDTTTKQILVASLVGIPVAYYMTEQYLQKFSQRIELEWWHFALPVLILIIILLATVIAVVWKAAKSNPVEALKYE